MRPLLSDEEQAAQIAAALASHAEAVELWGRAVTEGLKKMGEQVAELEGRVGRIERRIRFVDAERAGG